MKLWKKLSLVTVTVILMATGISGATVIYRSVGYNQEKTIESCEQQLHSTAYALARELENSPAKDRSEAAKNSYITYLIKKYSASKYILIEDDKVICNLTPFELKNPQDDRWSRTEGFSIIQVKGEQYILISGKKVPAAGEREYKLVLVKDISDLYRDIQKQIVADLMILALAAVLAMVIVFFVTRKIMQPLRELQQAAQDISQGKLKRRADVHTRDEVGLMAQAFNSMADRIENQVTELSKVSEQRRQMLGSLTHELKTPMTSIIGYSDTLLHVNLKKGQQERALWHIKEECRRLEHLSSKLMSLIGLYENDSIYMEETSMDELFGQVARLEEHHLQQRKVRLEYSCAMEPKKIDKDLFESLLVNLIDNGAKASREGDVILLKGEGNIITVQDFGCGIPEEEIGRVTEAFYMVDKARSRKAGGCGLGLALCILIAQLHGARVLIESKVGKGTKVSVIFER
ncbi:MAG: HAMP domain-containing histidine kinase [Lachnospiraceae bacterium]|nr:HAMP domain-containing histidine kinase [Lachnospiraceae bacterium]